GSYRLCVSGAAGLPDLSGNPLTGAGAGGDHVVAFAITDSYFLPLAADKITIPPELRGAEKIAQQVSEVVIEPDGRISNCKGVRYSGAAGPETDACRLLTNARFVPSAPDGPAMTGTIVMTVYLEKHSVT
ncbi:MAG: energy transducer TonB family protein, partial [Sphingomicrobium sp.]